MKKFKLFALLALMLIGAGRLCAQTSLLLDYDAIDENYGYNQSDSLEIYTWNLNKNYPADSNLTIRFASVLFDTLVNYDYNAGTLLQSYQASLYTTRLDSFQLYYKHVRPVTSSTDTMYMYVYDLSQATITGTGPAAVFSAPWLWKDSIKINGTGSINSQGTAYGTTGYYTLTRRPNITLPAGKLYGVYIEFRGNKSNYLSVIASGRNSCGGSCLVDESVIPNNSAYFVNYKSSGTDYSGINSLYSDCNADNMQTPGSCEFFYIQNFWLPSWATITLTQGATPPTVVTTAATSVGSATATINGTVNANGNSSTVSFDWGLTTAYGNTATGSPSPVTGSTVTAVSANLSGLASNTTYHFRVNATNTGGTTHGGDLTFTTTAGGACTPDGNVTSGLSPASSNINCITQGQSFSQTFTFVVPATAAGGAITVTSMHIDSIGNMRNGFSWSANATPATYSGGSNGCFIVYGTTNDPCGQYTLPIYVTLITSAGTFSGELSSIASQASLTGFEMRFLRIIASGDPCPAVNSSQTAAYAAYGTCGGGSGINVSITKTDVNCFGQSTGSATAVATGGSNYTYAWSNSATTATISNLPAGTYTVTVTSGVNTATASVTITQPSAALTATASATQASCSQNNGTATVTATGGTPSYTYSWSNSGTSATISNLAPASYSVTVTDNKGCSASASATVTSPASFSVTVTGTNVPCYGAASGSATVSTSGTTGNVTYAWSNGGTSTTVSNLVAGTYTVTVTDGSGCSKTGTTTITQPANPLTATATATNTTCGASTGTATVTVTNNNGTPAYVWSNAGTTATINNLAVGVYTVTVTAGGCTATAAASVSAQNGPTVTLLTTNPTCFGSTNGSVTAVVSGGTSPYTYQWNTGATGTTLSSVGAGTYNLIVSDNGGCQAAGSATLIQPNVLAANPTVVNVNCNGNQTGSVTLSVTGGTGPYAYSWSNSSTSSSVTGVGAGTYTVTVTDSKSCTVVSSSNVTQPTGLTANVTTTATTGSDGTATVTATGGTSPYNYQWGNSQTSATATGLSAGPVSVTVTDSHGCSAIGSGNVLVNGINEITTISGISLYPNPATESINLVMDVDNTTEINFTVSDITGKVVYSTRESVGGRLTKEINVRNFTAGVYIMEIKAGSQIERRRFVVSHR